MQIEFTNILNKKLSSDQNFKLTLENNMNNEEKLIPLFEPLLREAGISVGKIFGLKILEVFKK